VPDVNQPPSILLTRNLASWKELIRITAPHTEVTNPWPSLKKEFVASVLAQDAFIRKTVLQVISVGNSAGPKNGRDTSSVQQTVRNPEYLTIPVLSNPMKLWLPSRRNGVNDVVRFARAREDEAFVIRSIKITLEDQSLMAPTVLAAGVSN
jgi:hypothetical protein